jgi:hypothetical protein
MLIRIIAIGGPLCFVFLSGPSYGWGLKNELTDPRVMATSLAYKINTTGKIKYCITIAAESSRFSDSIIDYEFRAALGVWLSEYTKITGKSIEVQHVNCNTHADIVVLLAATEAGDASNGAFMEYIKSNNPENDYLRLKIDTDYVWHETRSLPHNPNGIYIWQDSSVLIDYKAGESLQDLLEHINIENPTSLDQFATARNLPYNTVFWTTYRVFLHELGHAFGLCDTDELLFIIQCDSNYHSEEAQPSSLMKDSNYFYITPDDSEGMRAIIQRIEKLR